MRADAGVTLLELLVALALIALLATLAIPAFSRWSQTNRLAAGINRFHRSLELARSKAVERHDHVVVCKSADGHGCVASGGWEQGWLIFSDPAEDESCQDGDGDGFCDDDGGRIIRAAPGFAAGMTLHGTGNTADLVAFKSSGFPEGYPGTLTLCDRYGDTRGLVLSMQGRIRLADPVSDNLQCPP